MKNFYIEDYLKKCWENIDDVDKKAFLIFFLLMNVVYFYNSFFCLFGNHDIPAMFDRFRPFVDVYFGRYAAAWFEYLCSDKTMIPMFINIVFFFFSSVGTVMILKWLNLRKNIFDYLLVGSFVLLTPFLYSNLWYRITAVGHLVTVFFIVLSFLIVQKIEYEENILKKFFYFISSFLLMNIFVLGAYPQTIGLIFGLLFSKVCIDFFDSTNDSFKSIILKYRFSFLLVIFSSVGYLITLKVLKFVGIIDLQSSAVSMINLLEFYKYLVPFFVKTFNSFLFYVFPYVGPFYKSLITSAVFFSFVVMLSFVNKKYTEKKRVLLSSFSICLFYLFLFFIFHVIYFLCPLFYTFPKLFRLEYFSMVYFVLVCIVLSLKYSRPFMKKILYILLVIITVYNVQIVMHIQKDQLIGQYTEISRTKKLKDIIISNPLYEKTNYIKYDYIQIGEPSSLIVQIYNSNNFDEGYVNTEHELLKTFANRQVALFPGQVQDMPPKINNINSKSLKYVDSYRELEGYLNFEIENWLLKDARPFPSKNCVFINKGKIFVVMDADSLDKIKYSLKIMIDN